MKQLIAVAVAVAVAVAIVLTASPSLAQDKPQDKPTVSAYLAQGYQIVQSEIGNPLLQFILKKDNQLIWCSVELRTGDTQSCRTIK